MPSGFLLINKPYTWTSFDAIAVVRKMLGTKKVGHCGTLDPLATGLLLVAVGEGTKLLSYLVGANKSYNAEIFFGKRSTTDDAEGELFVEPIPEPTRSEFLSATKHFIGEISQIPPQFSALKIDGQKACVVARRGESIEMRPRTVRIDAVEIMAWNWPKVSLRIDCGSGTYIRALARDLGRALGGGAHLSALHRTKIGNFSIEGAIDPKSVTEKALQPLSQMLGSMPTVQMGPSDCSALQHGQPIASPHDFEEHQTVAVFCEEKLVSITRFLAANGVLCPIKNLGE